MTDPKLTPREPSEAERLAQELDHAWLLGPPTIEQRKQIAAELRRLQAENDALRAMHDAVATMQ